MGLAAADRVRVLVADKELQIVVIGKSFDRLVGGVTLPDGRDLGDVLVSEGLAQVDPKHAKCNNSKRLFELQAEAQKARRGLWGLPQRDQMPPWVWRKNRRKGASDA